MRAWYNAIRGEGPYEGYAALISGPHARLEDAIRADADDRTWAEEHTRQANHWSEYVAVELEGPRVTARDRVAAGETLPPSVVALGTNTGGLCAHS
jgi:hypothetical protein